MDPVNHRHGLQCTADASPFAIMAGREALCCDHLNLANSQVYASINPDCSCPDCRRHVEASDWSSVREAIPLVDLGFCFLQLPANDTRAVSASSQHLPAFGGYQKDSTCESSVVFTLDVFWF